MIRRQVFNLLRQNLRPSSTSTGVRGQHQPTKVMPVLHQYPKIDAMALVGPELNEIFGEIKKDLDEELKNDIELGKIAKYYFDGQGKFIRPIIAMTIGHAFNVHCGVPENSDIFSKQRKVAIVSEMIHTASLVHDDILDRAETRRGKVAINRKWDACRSTYAGDYILAVASKTMAQIRNEDVLIVLSQVLADLVRGEFQQLQNKSDSSERFQLYLEKTFNKTASLIAYSAKANGILASSYLSPEEIKINGDLANSYGRNIGIAFQLIDDLLDFVASSEQLGKPAAADLKLGLATAPVLFATTKFPELEDMIARRFSKPGDVEKAFEFVLQSDGLDRTRIMAREHCDSALSAIESLTDSKYKWALASMTDFCINRLK